MFAKVNSLTKRIVHGRHTSTLNGTGWDDGNLTATTEQEADVDALIASIDFTRPFLREATPHQHDRQESVARSWVEMQRTFFEPVFALSA